MILFRSGNSPLFRASASGGETRRITTLEQGEARHVNPRFLPDGRHFLYASFPTSSIYVGSLDSTERKLLLRDVGYATAYALGHMFFVREGTLMAQRFDAERLELTDEAFPVAEIETGVFAVSESGVLAYETGLSLERSRLAWVDRTGKPLGMLGDPARYYNVELSPDGTRVAGGIRATVNDPSGDVWIFDTSSDGRTRFTFEPAAVVPRAIWSPDGGRILFMKKGGTGFDLFQKASSGAGAEQLLLEDGFNKYPMSFSSDGRFVMYGTVPGSPTTGNDLWVLPLFGDRKPFPYLQTRFGEFYGLFSPDGRWVAYASTESGRGEVYVAAFPEPSGKRQISTSGGTAPRWRRDGREIFYLAPDNTMMAAAVDGRGAGFQVSSLEPLFETRRSVGGEFPYAVSPDGQRFLIIGAADDENASGINVVVNWKGASAPLR